MAVTLHVRHAARKEAESRICVINQWQVDMLPVSDPFLVIA